MKKNFYQVMSVNQHCRSAQIQLNGKDYTIFSEFKLNLNRLVATYYIMKSNKTLLVHCYTFFAECRALSPSVVDLIFIRDIQQNGAKMIDFFEKVYSAKLEKVDT